MIFHENRLLADDSYVISYLFFFFKLGKKLQNLSSAAVIIGALRVKGINLCTIHPQGYAKHQVAAKNFRDKLLNQPWSNRKIFLNLAKSYFTHLSFPTTHKLCFPCHSWNIAKEPVRKLKWNRQYFSIQQGNGYFVTVSGQFFF